MPIFPHSLLLVHLRIGALWPLHRGNFYATEFQANGMFGPDPAGAVIKVAPNGTRTTLGSGKLSFPSGFAYHDGAVYVSNWSTMPGKAVKSGDPTGEVVKISLR